ncbi:hypothetical protein, partial [Bradyrhizobium sp. AUGA SZCCT0222]|uniref:hypothetical protein n=1 Tax=Bradyrhizobium sp. AUGA SZCCT0222 TaxID=2807668 RepID=UPI001BADF085
PKCGESAIFESIWSPLNFRFGTLEPRSDSIGTEQALVQARKGEPEKEDAISGAKPAYEGFVDGSVIFCIQDSGS